MAEFPEIQYAQTVPGVVRQPRARLDVSTGQEEIARGLMQFGGALDEIATNIYNRESSAEYYEQKRRYDERGFALFNSASGDIAFDPETKTYSGADVDLWQQFEDDIEGELLQSKKPRVNALLGEHIDNTIVDWKDSYYKKSLGMAAKNAHATFESESGNALASGNLPEYYQQLETRLALKDITQAEYDYKVKNAVPDSVLEQSRHLIASDNADSFTIATNKLNSLDEKTLSTEQLEYRNKLLRMTEQTSKAKSDKALTEVIIQKENLKDSTPTEKANATAEMKQQLVDGGVKGDSLERWFGILDKWSGGDKDPTEEYDPSRSAEIRERVMLEPEGITDSQIMSLVGFGKEGGITSLQAQSFVDVRRGNIDQRPSLQKELHGRKQDRLKSMFDAELFGKGREAESNYNDMADKLTLYANRNKDFTKKEMDDFFAQLTAKQENKWWLKLIERIGRIGPPQDVLGQFLRSRQQEKLEKFTEQAKSAPITKSIGITTVVNGQKWILVEKGETPDKDEWEKVE